MREGKKGKKKMGRKVATLCRGCEVLQRQQIIMLLPKRWSAKLQSGTRNVSGARVNPIVVKATSAQSQRPSAIAPASCALGHGQKVPLASRSTLAGGRGRRSTVRCQALFGLFKTDPAETTRKKYQSRVDEINKLEPGIAALTDDQLRAKTAQFEARVAGGESLNSLLPEAFAVRSHVTLACLWLSVHGDAPFMQT